jgi:hypothetical protein
MSIVLFWIHDESPGRARTRKLIERTCTLVARLVSLASFPLLKPLRSDALVCSRSCASPRRIRPAEPGPATRARGSRRARPPR